MNTQNTQDNLDTLIEKEAAIVFGDIVFSIMAHLGALRTISHINKFINRAHQYAEACNGRICKFLGEGFLTIFDQDVFGTGVNLPGRLEPLCNPGGVILSDRAYQQLPVDLVALQRLCQMAKAPPTGGHGMVRLAVQGDQPVS